MVTKVKITPIISPQQPIISLQQKTQIILEPHKGLGSVFYNHTKMYGDAGIIDIEHFLAAIGKLREKTHKYADTVEFTLPPDRKPGSQCTDEIYVKYKSENREPVSGSFHLSQRNFLKFFNNLVNPAKSKS